MKALNKLAKPKLPDLPTVGMFAFALASTWSLYQFFNNHAIHKTWLYAVPAALVEIVTAWLTGHLVESVYQLTRSNITKQDRRFFWIVVIVSVVLVVPTFAASIVANRYEFQGEILLALLFPFAVAGCAIGAQIPRSVKRHKSTGDGKTKVELRTVKKELRETKAKLRDRRAAHNEDAQRLAEKVAQLRTSEQAVEMYRATARGFEQTCTELEQSRTLKRADKTIYADLCAGLNGSAPTDAQGVNDLLNDSGYYSKSDSTARNWARGETT